MGRLELDRDRADLGRFEFGGTHALGFKLMLVIPMALYLARVTYQENLRSCLLISLLLLLQIYLDRQGRRWPKPAGIHS